MRAEKENGKIAAPVLTKDGLKFDSGGLAGNQGKKKRKKNKFHNLRLIKIIEQLKQRILSSVRLPIQK